MACYMPAPTGVPSFFTEVTQPVEMGMGVLGGHHLHNFVTGGDPGEPDILPNFLSH